MVKKSDFGLFVFLGGVGVEKSCWSIFSGLSAKSKYITSKQKLILLNKRLSFQSKISF